MIHEAQAGFVARNDCNVRIIPSKERKIQINSPVRDNFRDQQDLVLKKILEDWSVENIEIQIEDKGALDYVWEARLNTALRRAGFVEPVHYFQSGLKYDQSYSPSRSILFVPGDKPSMLLNADLLEADTVILDLEDAVALEEKDAARDLVYARLRAFSFERSQVFIRINPCDTENWEKDLEAVLNLPIHGLLLPKAEKENMEKFMQFCKQIAVRPPIVLLIETVQGLLELPELLQHFLPQTSIRALALGGEDFARTLEVQRSPEGHELAYARNILSLYAHRYNLEVWDTPCTSLEDEEQLIREAKLAKSFGFTGKLAIHPKQIPAIHEVFSPTRQEVEEAEEILRLSREAREEGKGAFSYKGKMVDQPILLRAHQILEKGRRLFGHEI